MSLVVRFAPTGLTKAKYDSTIEKIKAEVLRTGRWQGELVHDVE